MAKHLGKNLASQSSWPLERKHKSPALILIYMNMDLIFLIFSHERPFKQETVSSSSLIIHPNFQGKAKVILS